MFRPFPVNSRQVQFYSYKIYILPRDTRSCHVSKYCAVKYVENFNFE
jgi:hypothetical protein